MPTSKTENFQSYTDYEFVKPNNLEKSIFKQNRNISLFKNVCSKVIGKSSRSTSEKLQLLGRQEQRVRKFYDDDIVRSISEELNDRLRAMIIVGDMIRYLHLSVTRKEITPQNFVVTGLDMITSTRRIFRQDIAKLTSIRFSHGNSAIPFMNGGPVGENWNKSANGFYDWLESKSCESILGIELGFKADNYGLEVSKKLIEKKKKNPKICINLLVDGFVSILMQKLPSSLTDFERNTISMIYQMRRAGIGVYVNDSWNPLSADFLAANHIKLWIFDGEAAFYGGIGIESQFRSTLYDEMDLVRGPFVTILTTMALLLMTNQRGHDDVDDEKNNGKQQSIYNMSREQLKELFIKDSLQWGNTNMRISMDVPGYIQDAQHDYVSLLTRRDVDEIYIMAPYFSDHKVAKALVVASDRLRMRYYSDIENTRAIRIKSKALGILKAVNKPFHYAIQKKRLIGEEVTDKPSSRYTHENGDNNKRIYVIFPKKQENRIIEEVSRYYAYYLRNNPVVETRQFYAEVGSEKYQMLHAKQMIVVLRNPSKNWTKYIKFGGSYNPAGRAQNMWEINAISFNGDWRQSDESPDTAKEKNPIKEYLDNVMKVIIEKYSQPFPWGQTDFKLSLQDKISMAIARSLWF